MFNALRQCDEVRICPISGETVKQLGNRARCMLMSKTFTGRERWQVRTDDNCVYVAQPSVSRRAAIIFPAFVGSLPGPQPASRLRSA
jgi:hypothetical protein